VYRQLLRMGRELDREPLAKALLIAQPGVFFDRRSRELVRLPQLGGPMGEWAQMLAAFNQGEFYSPSSVRSSSVRKAIVDSRHNLPDNDPVDVGLAALKTLSLAALSGQALQKHVCEFGGLQTDLIVTDRLQLASEVKVGNLLLAHPVACLSQPTLHHSVILLVAVEDDSVTGVVINKPLDIELGAAVSGEMREALGSQLAGATLHKGGDVSERQLLLLHDVPGVEDSAPIWDGLYCTTDFTQLRLALESAPAQDTRLQDGSHRAAPARFKSAAGFAGWARTQLDAELERNVWFMAEPMPGDSIASLALASEPEGHRAGWLRDSMWSGCACASHLKLATRSQGLPRVCRVMNQLGGEHVQLARFPGEHAIVWEHMQEIWQQQTDCLQRRIDLLDEPGGQDG